eukprot:7203-Heterococcus_DN1.PRE.4
MHSPVVRVKWQDVHVRAPLTSTAPPMSAVAFVTVRLVSSAVAPRYTAIAPPLPPLVAAEVVNSANNKRQQQWR